MSTFVCVVRDLKSTAGNALADAFRVHLSPDTLENLQLRIGDLCQLTTEDGKCTGTAIAWRATDKLGSPKHPPVKLSETLRETFGFKLGSQVTVEKSKDSLVKAQKIVLAEVTGSDEGVAQISDDECWIARCRNMLSAYNCETFTANVTFDVAAKQRGSSSKRRYLIKRVEPPPNSSSTALYTCTDQSDISIQTDVPPKTPTISQAPSPRQLRLESAAIGGLTDQIKDLNDCLTGLASNSYWTGPTEGHVLLHGHEGTGKTLILRELSLLPFRKVLIPSISIFSGSTSKSQTAAKEVFSEAALHEPSVIILDNIDAAAGIEDSVSESLYSDCFRSIQGKRVLVVAAARDYLKVNSVLFKPGMLTQRIELPVPDITKRKQILKALLREALSGYDDTVEDLATRTHGFTGQDLHLLVNAASAARRRRLILSNEVLSNFQPQDESPNGAVAGEKKTLSEPHPSEADLILKKEDFEKALLSVKPTALREIVFQPPNVQWDDIGGSDLMKRRFDKIIGWPLHHPDLMSIFNVEAKNGVLLYGPPGCSKTMTAQAVATTYGLNFIAVKGAELVSSYVGESERAIRDVFSKAKAAQPCIIFFDEFDSIASERGSDGHKGLNLVTTLLTEMDGFEKLKGVYVLAATNKPEALDRALMRPGRFDQLVFVRPPSESARREILRLKLGSLPTKEELDFGGVCGKTHNYSGADMVQLCARVKDLALERVIEGGEVGICNEDLERARRETRTSITEEMLVAYETFEQGSVVAV